MPTIVLNTSNDELLGFMLIAGADSIVSGPNERDCVFTGVPKDPSLFELPASELLQANKNQEFVLTVEVSETVTKLSVSLSNVVSFCATLVETKGGSWYFVDGDVATEVGRCKLL